MNKYLDALDAIISATIVMTYEDDEEETIKVFETENIFLTQLREAAEKAFLYDVIMKDIKELRKLNDGENQTDADVNAMSVIFSRIVSLLNVETEITKDKSKKN